MGQSKLDMFVGFFILVLALILYFYLIPNFVVDNGQDSMSPSFFPQLGTILIGMGGTSLIVTAIYSGLAENGNTKLVKISPEGLLNVFLIIVAIAGFIQLFQLLGYFYATPTLIAALMLIFGSRNSLHILIVAVISTVFFYVVFSFGLNLPLI